MPKNKQSNLIACVKTPNIGFIFKYIINSETKRGGLFSVSKLPITSLKYLSLSTPQFFFFIKYTRNRLLRVTFIEQ